MELYGCVVELKGDMTMALLMKECYLDFVSKSLQDPKEKNIFSQRLMEEQKEHSVHIKAIV